jgi:hypothetical protein
MDRWQHQQQLHMVFRACASTLLAENSMLLRHNNQKPNLQLLICAVLLLQDDHARQCQRDKILAQAPVAVAVAAAGGSSSSGSGSNAAAAAAGSPVGIDPALASLYKDPGDLSLKEGQTIR